MSVEQAHAWVCSTCSRTWISVFRTPRYCSCGNSARNDYLRSIDVLPKRRRVVALDSLRGDDAERAPLAAGGKAAP